MQASEIPSLLDDAGFQAALERFERLPGLAREEPPITDAQLDAIAEVIPRRSPDAPTSACDEEAQRRARAALERALEPDFHEQQHPHHSRARVPRAIVAFVVVLGFLTGVCAAAAMFHDRVAQLVVERVHLK